MRNRLSLSILILLFVLIISSCTLNKEPKNLEQFNVKKNATQVIEDDFIFRLVSEKEQYDEGETVKLYGEIVYKGDKEEVTIFHSSSAILFNITEHARDYEIGYGVQDIGVTTVLKQGEPFRENYNKNNVGYASDDNNVKFIKEFINRDDFPTGYYVVNGFTDFAVQLREDDEEMERIIIEATIDFKVSD